MITAFTPEGRALRSLLNTLIATQPGLSRALAEKLSALDVAYPSQDPQAHPLTGSRVPDLHLSRTGTRLFDALHTGRPVLLDLTGGALSTAADEARTHGVDVLAGSLGDPGPHPAWAVVQAALIRPDGHVWWAGEDTALKRTDEAARHAVRELGARLVTAGDRPEGDPT